MNAYYDTADEALGKKLAFERYFINRILVKNWLVKHQEFFKNYGFEITCREGFGYDGHSFYVEIDWSPHLVSSVHVVEPAFRPYKYIGIDCLGDGGDENDRLYYDDDNWEDWSPSQVLEHLDSFKDFLESYVKKYENRR